MESTLREYNSPRKRSLGGFCSQYLATLATPTIRSIKCKKSSVYRDSDRYFHIPLPIVTKHELVLPFLPSHKIWYKSVHNLFSYRGHRHTNTDRHTNQRR